MKIKICPICVVVSGSWLLIQVGIYGKLLEAGNWTLPAAIAMGGTVVGIAYQRPSFRWKSLVIAIGMPLAYFFVTHISGLTMALEIIILLAFAYIFFLQKDSPDNARVNNLMDKIKNCC